MNKKKMVFGGAFALILLMMISGHFLISTSVTRAENSTHVLYLTEKTSQTVAITSIPKKIHLGDRIIYTNDLFHENTLAGHDLGYCEIVAVAPLPAKVLCMTTLLISGSQLITSSLFTVTDELAQVPIDYAIVGGTGKFLGVQGIITRVQLTGLAKLTIHLKWPE